jgi:hypothetical protein
VRKRRKHSAGKGRSFWRLQWLEKSWRPTIVANWGKGAFFGSIGALDRRAQPRKPCKPLGFWRFCRDSVRHDRIILLVLVSGNQLPPANKASSHLTAS